MGKSPENALFLYNVAQQLRDDGYIDAYFAGGMTVGQLKLTREGPEVARNIDPFEQVLSEALRGIASDRFAQAFPGAFEPWANAERLLFGDDAEAQLTTIGHKAREAVQGFATAMIDTYGGTQPARRCETREAPSWVRYRSTPSAT